MSTGLSLSQTGRPGVAAPGAGAGRGREDVAGGRAGGGPVTGPPPGGLGGRACRGVRPAQRGARPRPLPVLLPGPSPRGQPALFSFSPGG